MGGRHHVLGIRSPDPFLSMVGAIGLGASVGTALIIDLAHRGRSGSRSLADLVADGPNLAELSPGKRGLAYLAGGGVQPVEVEQLVGQLATRWPAVVMRIEGGELPVPSVPIIPISDLPLAPDFAVTNAVWQPVGSSLNPPGPGPVLPRLRPALFRRLLNGQLPRRSRWLAAFGPVWEMPWE